MSLTLPFARSVEQSPLCATSRIGHTGRARSNRELRSMNAAVLVRPGHFELREASIPQPEPRQVRVRVEGCGVSASSLPVWEGTQPLCYPLEAGALGHEGWGRIDAIGSEVAGPAIGDRVGIISQHAFAEYALADANGVVLLPEGMASEPFPAAALGCAVNIFRRSFINRGDTVAIVGVGFLGALLTQLAALAEARVIAISRRPSALATASQLGAAETIALSSYQARQQTIETVRSVNGGNLCDIVIEATGMPEPLNLAGELTRERGRLVVAGYHGVGPREVDMQLWNWRGLDVVNAHERSPALQLEGMREAVAAVDCGLLTPSPLYTHTFPLEQLNDALHLCKTRPPGFMKALIRL